MADQAYTYPLKVPDWDGQTELSVIIPFANEGSNVVFTVQALMEELNGFCKYEIILVDNMSDWYIECKVKNEFVPWMENKERPYPVRSRAYFIAPPESKKAGSRISTQFFKNGPCKYFTWDVKPGHWNAKNKGIMESRGKYLFFLDAHCIMNRDGVRHMIQFLREHEGEKIGGIHSYINYMLDARSLEYKPQKDKFFGYQFCTHQKEEYWLDRNGTEVEVSDEIRLVTRAQMNPPDFKRGSSWQDRYGSDPVVGPHLLPDEKGLFLNPMWPKRYVRFPTKPYEVCIISTCGMMCPRTVIQELGPWHPEYGIYCGGEGGMVLKQATCGYGHYIQPKAICWHWAEKRGYIWNWTDHVRNEFIAAYTCGGDRALDFCVEHRGKKEAILKIAADVREKCTDEMEFIKSKQVIGLEDYFDFWIHERPIVQR
jgi:hypothetical protein